MRRLGIWGVLLLVGCGDGPSAPAARRPQSTPDATPAMSAQPSAQPDPSATAAPTPNVTPSPKPRASAPPTPASSPTPPDPSAEPTPSATPAVTPPPVSPPPATPTPPAVTPTPPPATPTPAPGPCELADPRPGDAGQCEARRCDPDRGWHSVDAREGEACDDGNTATAAERCVRGNCLGRIERGCHGAAQPTLRAQRGGERAVFATASYEYVPSLMLDGSYRMWWCAGVAGDHIGHAEADAPAGPWHARGNPAAGSFDDVFQPTGDAAHFDGTHTCDPSVVRANGTYYLYYGAYPSLVDGDTTRIGVASSPDGMSWTRMNGGAPIVVPRRDHRGLPNPYGAGQPSVVFLDGWFYLIHTDSTGLGGNPFNGAGQYVLRSQDPTFQTGVEERLAAGWSPYDAEAHTTHSVLESFSVDMMWSDALGAFIVASHTAPGETQLIFFDRDFTAELHPRLSVPGNWRDGPGLVRRPDGHALPGSECGVIPIDIVRAVGPESPYEWDLAHKGADLHTGLGCDCADPAKLYEGELLAPLGLPLTLVRGGERVQFALAPPAAWFSKNTWVVPAEIFHRIPYGASMHGGATVIGAPGRPGAFVLDNDRLWPVSCIEAVTANGSTISSVSVAEWDGHPVAHSLFCVR